MIERERLVGKPEVDGSEPAAAVRERSEPAGVGHEGRERVGPDETGNLARARFAHLAAVSVDRRPVEIDQCRATSQYGPSVRRASVTKLAL